MNAQQMLNSNPTGGAQAKANSTLVNRWSKFTEGVNGWDKMVLSKMFENQMTHFWNYGSHFLEATTTANIPNLVKFTFPLIREIWPNLVAKDLFSVQPTLTPIGGIYYYKLKYGSTKGTITAGDEMINNFDRNYTSELIEDQAVGTGTNAYTGTFTWVPVKPYSLGQAGIVFTGTNGTGDTKTIADIDGSGTLVGDTGATSTITYSTGAYNITFDEVVTGVTATYYYDMESGTSAAMIPEMSADIQLDAIKVWSRKLKILWNSEITDDMKAILGMDIEPELTAGMAAEIMLGIDRELIMAAYGATSATTIPFDAAVPAGRNQIDHYRNILTVLEKGSSSINTETRRGNGNFIVMGPSVQPVVSALASHGDMVLNINGGVIPAGQGVGGQPQPALPMIGNGNGIYTLGFLQNRWRVVVDPFFPAGEIMVGLKGQRFADAGVVYAPYVPLEMTSAFLDPGDWTVRKGIRTRYARKVVNNKFYKRISVSNYI